ncbi:sensor histidine kinase [Eudoraea chungangensis]|uniref:sensor histidine kinase n=1 Tax=Eudoraea chungangensis TaxID=1481905 RepID=UPI0023EBABAD|nr:histidine kinase [Eudoraea chungangensis]
MNKKSLRHTILINIGAFLLVATLEILGGWLFKDNFDDDYSFILWQLGFAASIMGVIWVNHFILIPVFYDKKKYLSYGILLVAIIFGCSYLKGYSTSSGSWIGVYKMFFFLIYTTGTGMAAFFLRRNMIFRRENEEKEKLQKEMELNYLKEQVNPHFLFNSLNSIYSLSREQSPETPAMVMQLSELMRYQLESAKKDRVLVKEELEFIENYLLLEEKRLSNRCNIEFLIDGALSDYAIAPMLLIPFVENAIKHGAQSTNEISSLDVSATMKKTRLHFSVLNSKPTKLIRSEREGLGLENVKRRLELLYPKSHDLSIKDSKKTFEVVLTIDLKSPDA